MGLITPNGNIATPNNPLGGHVVDIGELISKISADVAAKVMNTGWEESFKESIAPYEKRIEELEAQVKELKGNEG